MWSAISPTSVSIPKPPPHRDLSSSRVLSCPLRFPIVSFPTATSRPPPTTSFTIRMGGGPRTYPGGVSKWQWKRMQAKKAKQLLKARLCRERQIYEMRKRAELKAAVSELERPWEVVERAPTLFSVKADEQVKVLADRFQKPGGFDMWSERDGPQVLRGPNGLPSARFFPKGVVHSVRPYGVISGSAEREEEGSEFEDGEGLEFEDRFGQNTIRNYSNQRRDRTMNRRKSSGKAGRLSSRDDGRRKRLKNPNSPYDGHGDFSGVLESDSSENDEEELMDLVDRMEIGRGGGRTSSSQYAYQHSSSRQKDGSLKQKGDARFEGLSSARQKFVREGKSLSKSRNLGRRSIIHGGNGTFTKRGRRVADESKQDGEDSFSFHPSKMSSRSFVSGKGGMRILKNNYDEKFYQRMADSKESSYGVSENHVNRRSQATLHGLDPDEIALNTGGSERMPVKADPNKSDPEHGLFGWEIPLRDDGLQIRGGSGSVRSAGCDEEDTKAL